MSRILTVLFMIFSLSGCLYTKLFEAGSRIEVRAVHNIKKGKTTEQQLEALLGLPFSKTRVNRRDTKWLYSYTFGYEKGRFFSTTFAVNIMVLEVTIRRGVVIDYQELALPLGWR